MTVGEWEQIIFKGSIKPIDLWNLHGNFDVEVSSLNNYYWVVKLKNQDEKEELARYIENVQKNKSNMKDHMLLDDIENIIEKF